MTTATLTAKWAPRSKSERYEPLVDLEQRIARVRRRYAAGPHYARRLEIFDKATAKINPTRFARLQEKYKIDLIGFDIAGPFKYVDVVYWIWHKTALVESLGLDRCDPKAILDIGMGGGHFSFLCEALGHTTVGTDIAYPVYDDICEALGVARVKEGVYAFQPLPSFEKKFDLVTALWLMFNFTVQRKQRTYWTNAEWSWLLHELALRLNASGRIYLELNQHRAPDGSLHWDEAFINAARDVGAEVQENSHRSVTFDAASASRFVATYRSNHELVSEA